MQTSSQRRQPLRNTELFQSRKKKFSFTHIICVVNTLLSQIVFKHLLKEERTIILRPSSLQSFIIKFPSILLDFLSHNDLQKDAVSYLFNSMMVCLKWSQKMSQQKKTTICSRTCDESNCIKITSTRSNSSSLTLSQSLDFFCLWNVRSVKNKALSLKDYTVEHVLTSLP